MTNMAGALLIIIICVLLFVTFTKIGKSLKLRAKGAAQEAIAKDAATPEGAKAYYNTAISKKQDDYKKASEIEQQMLGKIKSYEDQLYRLQKDDAKIDQDASALVKRGDEESARVLLERQADNEDKAKVLKEALKKLREAEKIQKETVDSLYEQLDDLKNEKDKAILTLETAQVTDSLHSTTVDNTEDEMLNAVREGVKKTQEKSDGRAIQYENSAEAKQKKLNKTLKDEEIDKKLKKLKGAK